MKPRTKFLLGGALVLVTSGYLMTSSIKSTGTYYLTPSELNAKVEKDPSFRQVGVKVGARVVRGTIERDPSGRQFRFLMTDTTSGSRDTIPVVYRGLAPDTFTDGVDVVVDGRLESNGTFQATTLVAKCASRYEAAPEKPTGGKAAGA